MPGKGLAVGVALWKLAALRHSEDKLAVTLARLRRETGLSRGQCREGLRELEAGGLIAVERPPGKAMSVSLRGASGG